VTRLARGWGDSRGALVCKKGGGQLRGELKLGKARQTEAAVSYAKTLLTAFCQVNTALVAHTQAHVTVAAPKTDVQQSRVAVTLAEE
jgi:outer membrane protein TolC